VKLLFAHRTFPGQFVHLLRHLAAQQRHDLVFITELTDTEIAGVRKMPYRVPPSASARTHPVARDFDAAARRAEVVGRRARILRQLGYVPDIIIGHHGWGELLELPDIWPDVPLLGYLEYFYRTDGADVGFDPEFALPRSDYPGVRAKNVINLQAFANGGFGLTPTEWQLSTYPDWMRDRIILLREGVNLEICRPDPGLRRQTLEIAGMAVAPAHRLVTYVARGLEPYRGFHVMMRAIPHLLRARADIRIVIVGGEEARYGPSPPHGSWKDVFLAELGSAIDPTRVVFPGWVDYGTYMRLLQRSDAHVYLTYPFLASWSLREALAIGCPVIGSDTAPVREFITHGENGLLTDCLDPVGLAATVMQVLENAALARRLRAGARRYAEQHLAMDDYLAGFEGVITRLVGRSL
jgi:glycosyltransferase involved in cell wall biosynthesis